MNLKTPSVLSAVTAALMLLPRDDTSMPQQCSFPVGYCHISARRLQGKQVSTPIPQRVRGALILLKTVTPEGYSTFFNMGSVSIFSHYQTRKLFRKSRHKTDLLQTNAQNISILRYTGLPSRLFYSKVLIYILLSRLKRPFHAKLKSIL